MSVMKNKMSQIFIIFAALVFLYKSVNAESIILGPVASPSPAAASVNCYDVIIDMADCLTFVSNGSMVTQPDPSCCIGLEEVLKVDPECLCEGLAKSGDFGVVLNMTKALTLPSICHISTPPFSNCGIALAPTGDNVSPDPNSSGGASDVAPAPAPIKAASSAVSAATVLVVVNLIIASLI